VGLLVDKQLNNLRIISDGSFNKSFKTIGYKVFSWRDDGEKVWITFLKSRVRRITQAAENPCISAFSDSSWPAIVGAMTASGAVSPVFWLKFAHSHCN
jgi:hypothetical protein